MWEMDGSITKEEECVMYCFYIKVMVAVFSHPLQMRICIATALFRSTEIESRDKPLQNTPTQLTVWGHPM